ncbi:hypothetical protein HN587_03730 [Candidatus Woesearchaeota archaeon]|nr:hypothetical protein [Candidatus Woesearchaeota archaeon]
MIFREKDLQKIAIFMVFLIITLPIYVSEVNAAMITNVDVYGQKQIINQDQGFIESTDTLTVIVNSTISSTEDNDLGANQVKILEEPGWQFECELINATLGKWSCNVNNPEFSVPPSMNVLSFKVQLFNDANMPMSPPKGGQVLVERLAPSGTWDFQMNETHTWATFDIEDKSCVGPACSGKCSGVKELRFNVDGNTIAINTTFDDKCKQIGEINLPIAVQGTETKHICMELTDNIGIVSKPICHDIELDKTPPNVEQLIFIDSNGNTITSSNGQVIENAALIINISEDKGLNGTLVADLTGINPSPAYAQFYKEFTNFICIQPTEGIYQCRTPQVLVVQMLPEQKGLNLQFSVTDINGNLMNKSKTYPIEFDNTPPQLAKIIGFYEDEKGVPWINKTGNDISAVFTETGSGLDNKYIYADFSTFGQQELEWGTGNILIPHSCESGWTCTWKNIQVNSNAKSGDAITITFVNPSRDDAGNFLETPTTVSRVFKFDEDSSEIINHSIEGIGLYGSYSDLVLPGYEGHSVIVSGDKVLLTVNVTDHTPVIAYANFSSLMEDGQTNMAHHSVEGNCEEVGVENNQRLFSCEWESDATMKRPATVDPLDTVIGVKFIDGLEHVLEEDLDVVVLGVEDNETPDYWMMDELTYEDSVSPQYLDRFAWSISIPQTFNKKIITSRYGSSVKMATFEFDPNSCEGEGSEYLMYDEDGNFRVLPMGYDPDISDGITDIFLAEFNPSHVPPSLIEGDNDTGEVVYEGFNFTCQASIVSIVNNRAITAPEIENITFQIKAMNNPIGSNLGNVKKQIQDDVDWVTTGWWDAVKWIKIITDYLRFACDMVDTLNTVMGVLAAVGMVEGAACATYQTFCSAAGENSKETEKVKVEKNNMLKDVIMACALFISCKMVDEKSIDETPCETWCKIQKAFATWRTYVVDLLNVQISSGPLWGERLAGKENRDFTLYDASTFDPYKSMFASAMTGCLPGIFYNLEKLRQIRCRKIICMKQDVAYGVGTVSGCDLEFRTATCTFWWGQALNTIPYVQMLDQLMGQIESLILNPFNGIGLIIDYACSAKCAAGDTSGICAACSGLEYANTLLSIVDTFVGIGDRWDALGKDLCEQALKDD